MTQTVSVGLTVLTGVSSPADQLTELIAIASRNVVLRMVRNGLTAQAQRLAEMSELERQVAELKGLVAALTLQAKDERVAMR